MKKRNLEQELLLKLSFKERIKYLSLVKKLDNLFNKFNSKKCSQKCSHCTLNWDGGKRTNRGCCSSCKNLTKNGCSTKSLMCKLWLCNPYEMKKMIAKIGKLNEWLRIQDLAFKNDFLRYRDLPNFEL